MEGKPQWNNSREYKMKKPWPLCVRIVVAPIRFLVFLPIAVLCVFMYMAGEGDRADTIMDWVMEVGTE